MANTKIDRAFLRTLRERLQPQLDAIAEELGVSMTTGRATYDYSSGNMKIEIASLNEDGVATTPERTALDWRASSGMIPFKAGDTFLHRGETYTVTGYNTRARKRPVQTERSDGKVFVWPQKTVELLIKGQS